MDLVSSVRRTRASRRVAQRVALVALAATAVSTVGCSRDASDASRVSGVPVAAVDDAATTSPLEVTLDDVVTAEATRIREGAATVLSSPDTLDARVVVPDAALRAGVDPEDLRATVLSFDSAADAAAGITFELGPDGATFAAPVLLEWDGPWSPAAAYSLSAHHGDGTAVEDEGRTDANSIAALQVEPTSDSTARYTLPVDHFSTWNFAVVVEIPGDLFGIFGGAEVPDEITVGVPETVQMRVLAFAATSRPRRCAGAVVLGVTGPLMADVDSSSPACSDTDIVRVPATLTCTGDGAATASVALYALVVVTDPDERTRPRLRTGELAALMLRSANDLVALTADPASSRATLEHEGRGGALFRTTVEFSVRCVDADSSTIATSSPTTDATSTTPSASGATTRPSTVATTGSSTSVVAPVASTTTPTSAPAGVTTSAAPASGTTTTSSPAPATTAPAASTTTSTTTSSTTTTTSWGPEGAWAYNEYGSCNYNGSGGCGWYFGATVGVYVLGPLGP